MNLRFVLLFHMLCPLFFIGQNQNPVSWSAVYTETNDNEGIISITASIQPAWHIYSQRPTEAGPIPTSFTFTPGNNFELLEKTQEENAKEEFVKAFDAKVFVFTGKAVFKQRVKRLNTKKFIAPLALEYMTCNDMMCLPPKTVELSINVPAVAIKK